MPENDFLVWAPSGGNVMSQSSYAASAYIANGVVTGLADPSLYNKSIRQGSIIASVIAQFIVAQTGATAIDDGSTSTLLANLDQGLQNIANSNFLAISANTTLVANDSGLVLFTSALSSTATATLPSPPTPTTQFGPQFFFVNLSAYAQTIATPSGTFGGPDGNGSSTFSIYPTEVIQVFSVAGAWLVMRLTKPSSGGVTYTTPGSINFTVPNRVFIIDVIMTGGGAPGGGCNSTVLNTNTAAGGGGGAGATALFKAAVTPGQVIAGTVGAGGSAGSNGGGTIFLGCTAGGGTQGIGTGGGVSTPGGAGGQVSGTPTGLLSSLTFVPGGIGDDGCSGNFFCGGNSGASYWGGGSRASTSGGVTPTAWGSGGGGCYNNSSGTGSSGAGGIIKISYGS